MTRSHRPCWGQHLSPITLLCAVLGCLAVPALRAQSPAPKGDAPADRAAALVDKSLARDDANVAAGEIWIAVAHALPPLEKTLVDYAEKRDCFSCHNQTIPLVALRIARSRGFTVDEDAFDGAVALTLGDLETALEDYQRGRGQPGGATRAGYALLALETGKHQPDETTAAVAEFLLKVDRNKDHWTTTAARVPMEASHFTTTALALRGLEAFAPKGRSDALKNRVNQARSWLSKSKPTDTEDRVFRLWGLKYSGARPDEIQAAVKDLLVTQRSDGGWAQIEELASDAYATGSALVAVHEAGGLSTDDRAYRRGVAFLLRSQKTDGTWFVASRSKPFQPYFESGFPYGKDQFIAVAASAWATAALALALPPSR
jgi:squalene cyclase